MAIGGHERWAYANKNNMTNWFVIDVLYIMKFMQ